MAIRVNSNLERNITSSGRVEIENVTVEVNQDSFEGLLNILLQEVVVVVVVVVELLLYFRLGDPTVVIAVYQDARNFTRSEM